MIRGLKRLPVFIWNKSIDYKILTSNKLYILKDKIIKVVHSKPNVSTMDETLDYIITNKCSVSRFGDGELKLILSKDIFFQKASSDLSKKLKEVANSNVDKHIVCVPEVFGDLSVYDEEPFNHWQLHIAKTRSRWYSILNKNKKYYNAFISRCYYAFKDKSNSKRWFDKLKLIWKDREIVIIEGKKSRLGIGNDLFTEVKSIERILCPEKNAFSSYEAILSEAKKTNKSKLILLAIGPTATVLSYELCKLGYQAIDIGHLDIEYEWFLMGATKKEKIKNKYIGEAIGGANVGECNDSYYIKQIKAIVK